MFSLGIALIQKYDRFIYFIYFSKIKKKFLDIVVVWWFSHEFHASVVCTWSFSGFEKHIFKNI